MRPTILAFFGVLSNVLLSGVTQGQTPQNPNETAAVTAIRMTPMGALPILNQGAVSLNTGSFTGAMYSYSQLSTTSNNASAKVTGSVRGAEIGGKWGPGILRLQYGQVRSTTDMVMAGTNTSLHTANTAWGADYGLVGYMYMPTPNSVKILVGLDGAFGFSSSANTHLSARSYGATLPLTLAIPIGGVQTASVISASIAPGYGWGRLSGDSVTSRRGSVPFWTAGGRFDSQWGGLDVAIHKAYASDFDIGATTNPLVYSIGLRFAF